MARTLAIGLSGQVGVALQPLLGEGLAPVLALSRDAQPAHPLVQWQRGTLDDLHGCPPGIECILSLGPLDAFARWLGHAQPRATRIVALSSTGLRDKQDSADPRERDEARRLAEAEAVLLEHGARHGAAVTVLRPTLLYGNGRDRSLSRLAALARRWRRLPWPAQAAGLRQPVHVEDVARAVLDSLDSPAAAGRAFDLPGAERLRFDAMVERYLAVHAPGARLWRVPAGAMRGLAALAGGVGRGGGLRAWLARAARDQVAEASAAAEAFGYRPRGFAP